MAFANEILTSSSERDLLVRLEPARYVNDDLASEGGGIYSLTFLENAPIFDVERNGTSLIEDSATPTVDDHWYFNEDTRKLEIKLAAAPSASNIVVASYYLFYTTGQAHVGTIAPDNTTSNSGYVWQPRIQNKIQAKSSIKNVFTGIMTVSTSSLTIANPDRDFNQYITNNDSFKNRPLTVWIYANGVENYVKFSTGSMSNITAAANNVTINVRDPFAKLREPLLMGDSADDATFYARTGSFPSMQPSRDGTPIPYIINRSSTGFLNNNRSLEGLTGGLFLDFRDTYVIDPSKSLEAICTTYEGAQTSSNDRNRDWGICRTSNVGFHFPSFGTITAASVSISSGLRYEYVGQTGGARAVLTITTSGHTYEVGDSFKITRGGTHYATVTNRTSTSLQAMIHTHAAPGAVEDWLTATTYHAAVTMAVVIKQGSDLYFPVLERDFTISDTATAGNTTYRDITFTDAFEANHAGLNGLNPDEHQVFYRATESLGAGRKHGHIIEDIFDRHLDKTIGGVAAANTALSVNLAMSMPKKGDTKHQSAISYLEDILSSSLGYLIVDGDLNFSYGLFDTPSSTDVRDDNLVLRNSGSVAVDYEDIVTEMFATNPQDAGVIPDTVLDSTVTKTNDKARYLHKTENAIQFEHVLEDMTTRLQDILDVRSNPQNTYTFSVATEDLQSLIGDDIQLDSDNLLGIITSKDLTIIDINKGTSKVTVKATDLGDL